jgi:hypothetical protein
MKHGFRRPLAAGISALALLASTAQADQQFLDDVIVDGSLCVGQDCVNGENFGFDTIRLKENNLRIRAMDTSNSGSFPTRDWQITFNDSSNGGQDKFSIDDIDAGRTPFTIEASAPSHSLYVDDGGRIGLGTSTPVVELQVVDGDSPTLRLEQDGSSGFTAQTWDVAGNETNFFVRDVTNGSRLPFKIRPSAPTNSIYVDTDGDIGLGTASPDAGLHVTRGKVLVEDSDTGSAALAPLHIRGDGSARRMIILDQTTASSQWVIANYETTALEGAGNFGINLVGGGNMFRIDTAGNLYFPTLTNCANGIQTDASGQLSCLP